MNNTFNFHNKKYYISLVIPVRDESETIKDLVDSIVSQTSPPDEVIFVDGGSKDDTVKRLREAGRRDKRIRVIEAGEATPGRGRNLGISAANYEWIALTDAGIRLESEWLENLIKPVDQDPEIGFVYGNYEPVIMSFFENCAALAYLPPKRQTPEGVMRWPFIASSLVRREVWESAGGFPDLRAAEDLIFMKRVEDQGVRTGWAPRATVWWKLRPTLGSTFRKFLLYSRHNVLAGWQRYWHYGIARQYAAGLALLALSVFHSKWWLAVLLLGIVVRVAKSIWARREGRGLRWFLNPIQFVYVCVIMTVIDLAAFIGWGQATWLRITGEDGLE
jgi:glycosyltransferase involved in cell wall biosynthesis